VLIFKPSGRRSRHVGVVSAVVLVVAGAALVGGRPAAVGAAATDGTTARVSVSNSGGQSDGGGVLLSISPDGRFVLFGSGGSDLSPDQDTNDATDVFVRDRTLGTTSLVSVSSEEAQGNNDSGGGGISADGRYVAFTSNASNLVPGDTNSREDVFVRDRTTGSTRRVSVRSNESQGNRSSLWASISADGRYVAYQSSSSNLVRGDTNRTWDVFVRDRMRATTMRVSVSSTQRQGNEVSRFPVISGDGQRVLYVSYASNLVPGDTNRRGDLFVRYRPTGTTSRASVSSNERQGNADTASPSAITPDGRYVAMQSSASNLVSGDTGSMEDVFVRDRSAGTTQRVSVNTEEVPGDSDSRGPSISADGQRVAFFSWASNLVDGDSADGWLDVFVRDRVAGTTSLVSVSTEGTPGNELSVENAISGDGGQVAFSSWASNLVPGDTNGQQDAFVRELAP